MHLLRTLRVIAGLITATILATALATTPAAARIAPDTDPQVRLVVRTESRAAVRDVLEAAIRRGASAAGKVRKLRAVALDVPQSRVAALTRALLRRPDVTDVDQAERRWLTEEPADPRFVDQRTYLDAIRATIAWERPAHGSPDVRIGIVDSGVDVTHPDLAPKIAGRYNAVTGSTDVRDVVGHGTGVASVAAAATGNGVGIAGAGYDSTLLVAKVADRTGRIFTDDLAAGIVWAVDSGADIINLSLGGPSSDDLERAAVAYAQRRGVLVVAAAGNAGSTTKQFPAALPGVLSVGATSANGATRAPFSSFGSWVDVAAPGRDLLVASPGGGYDLADGTSFASPLVAGQAALLAAFRPGRTADELSLAIRAGANTAKLGFARGLVDFAASLDLLPPATVPTVTAPAEGSSVSGVATVTASSTAPKVRLTLGDLSATVVTGGGTASASFPTYGLAGAVPVTATDCSAIDQCAGASAAVTAVVDNAAADLTAPVEGFDASADSFTVSALAPADAGVRFLVDGRAVADDTAAPFRATVSTEDLASGNHTVTALLCRHDGTVCAPSGESVNVTVDRLHPRLVDVTRRAISPDGDGRQDDTRLTYRLGQRHRAALVVRDRSGAVVLRRDLGVQPAGTHAVRWDGQAGGRPVRNGTFSVGISTAEPGGTRIGLASTTVVVDRIEPQLRNVTRSYRAVLPVRDDYRDTVRLTGRVSEEVRWVQVEARGPAGVVRGERVRRVAAGPVSLSWAGRTRGGRALPAGRYALRLVSSDAAGNVGRSAAVDVQVSDRRLVRRSGTMTVTARESLDETFSDDCSLVFRHTDGKRAGWIGYYSSGTCTSDDAYAVGDHQVRLPKAVRYGTVQVSAFGGRGDPKYRDSAVLTYYDRYQNPSRHTVRLGPSTRKHDGPRVKAEPLLVRKRLLRWSTTTTDVAWYDVEFYTVRYTYFVLR